MWQFASFRDRPPDIISFVKVSTQRLPESQVLLEIEVDPEQMERSLDKAYRKLVQRVAVPGFRKGKTPREMLERHVGRDRLVHEAHDILIPEVYNVALDEQAIDAIGQPSIELVTEEPLAFKATVPIRPTVELGDYKKLRVEREPVTVDPADVDSALEEMRRRYAVHEPVDRPVQAGDIVRAGVTGVVDGQQVYKDDDVEFRVRAGAIIFLPGFADGIVGAEKGVAKEIPVAVPEGERPLAGKSGVFTATVKEVKQESLPELTDDFAREVGEGFASVNALRERLENDMRERLEAQAEDAYRDKAVGALAENARAVEFPPVMVEREIQRFIADQARSTGQEVETYLGMINRTAEQLHEELVPSATARVRRSLALSQLAEDEGIEVTDADVSAEIDRMSGSAGDQGEQMRALLSRAEAREAIERSLITRKTVDRLLEFVNLDGTSKAAKKKNKKTKPEVQLEAV